jgi:hypothetical protein
VSVETTNKSDVTSRERLRKGSELDTQYMSGKLTVEEYEQRRRPFDVDYEASSREYVKQVMRSKRGLKGMVARILF